MGVLCKEWRGWEIKAWVSWWMLRMRGGCVVASAMDADGSARDRGTEGRGIEGRAACPGLQLAAAHMTRTSFLCFQRKFRVPADGHCTIPIHACTTLALSILCKTCEYHDARSGPRLVNGQEASLAHPFRNEQRRFVHWNAFQELLNPALRPQIVPLGLLLSETDCCPPLLPSELSASQSFERSSLTRT